MGAVGALGRRTPGLSRLVSDPKKHFCFWPSRLALQVERSGGTFDLGVTVFHETWVPLPGGKEVWPLEVKANGAPLPVIEHEGHPAVRLAGGRFRLEGAYRWSDVPQRIPIPREIGILALAIDGKPVEAPVVGCARFSLAEARRLGRGGGQGFPLA